MQADELIRMALQEDITSEDVSTNAVMRSSVKGSVELLAKEDGIIAGLDVYARVFQILDEKTEISCNVKDGDSVKKGELLATVTGDIRVLLSGERVALNYLQRMSGIATYTNQVAKLLEGSKVTLLDTRKTTPNCRVFEKYAVRVGGGCNHRYNLSDGVLLKDNHIGAAGSVAKAVAMAKEYAPFVRKIEVEVETMEQVEEAVEAGADIIMLDNMTPEMMKEAVDFIAGRAQTECSGNITKENIAKILETGVDFVSSGALTHSAPILDISMKNLDYIEQDDFSQIRTLLFDNPNIIDHYISENPEHLTNYELTIINDFKAGFIDDFLILTNLDDYTLVSNETGVYAIYGLVNHLKEIYPNSTLPQVCNLALLPYRHKIVFDGLLEDRQSILPHKQIRTYSHDDIIYELPHTLLN